MAFRNTLDFLLYHWLDAESLNQRPRFADHSRETFDAVFDTCERIAREKYAPFNRTVDTQEPHFDGEKVILVKPLSYYNDTGMVARLLIDYYKLTPAEDFLVVHDDLSLPLGTIRIRESGSDAGNNGIKSLNAHLGDGYRRIRVGIWTELRDRMDDVNFVLGNFSKDEHDKLTKDITPKTIELIERFIGGTLESTSHKV